MPQNPRVHEASRSVRVLLAGMPPILRDIVRETIARQPDMAVVAELDTDDALGPALAVTDADVVILGSSGSEDSTRPLQVLIARPQTCVLMLQTDGRHAALYELRPHRTRLGDVSPQALVDAIRARAAWSWS